MRCNIGDIWDDEYITRVLALLAMFGEANGSLM
jgi:hypothetical protein